MSDNRAKILGSQTIDATDLLLPRPRSIALETGTGPLAGLIKNAMLYPVFQPIAALDDGTLYAHEALIRGPQDSLLHMPSSLFLAARMEELQFEFETEALILAIESWIEWQTPGRLFVNIGADVLVNVLNKLGIETLRRTLCDTDMKPRRLVLEITEHERVQNLEALAKTVNDLRTLGVQFALDDFGDGHSSLRLWSEIKPDIVKIDKYFTRDIANHAQNLQTLRALMQIAEVFDTQLVAEGIETADDLRVLRDLGISYGQGYFLGRPHPSPQNTHADALSALKDRRVSVFPAMKRNATGARGRAISIIEAPALPASTTNNALVQMFLEHSELHAIAIVDEAKRPVGLVNRHQYMTAVARPFFKEIFGRENCLTLANMSPRVIENDPDLEDLLEILTSADQRYLTEGFIVTQNGSYAGLGTGEQLVRSVTEMRIEAARHANPLTFLPGNIPISQHIERLLLNAGEFVACYADLNHFKPFNDQYGYWRGDEMIRLLARVCVSNCDPRNDFVGHVGGDDFIFLMQSTDWETRCLRVIDEFNRDAVLLFDDTARQNGGIHGEDRHGVMRFFPFTTLSIGALRVKSGKYKSAEAVANDAAHAKHMAKLSGQGLAIE